MTRRPFQRRRELSELTRAGRRLDRFRRLGFKSVPGSGEAGRQQAALAWVDYAKRGGR